MTRFNEWRISALPVLNELSALKLPVPAINELKWLINVCPKRHSHVAVRYLLFPVTDCGREMHRDMFKYPYRTISWNPEGTRLEISNNSIDSKAMSFHCNFELLYVEFHINACNRLIRRYPLAYHLVHQWYFDVDNNSTINRNTNQYALLLRCSILTNTHHNS